MSHKSLDAPRGSIYLLDPEDIIIPRDEKNPLFDPRGQLAADPALVLNIQAFGVIEPVIVRKMGENIEVVDGRRRIVAARAANVALKKIGGEPVAVPCLLRRGEDGDLFSVCVSANEMRLDDNMLARARKANRLEQMGKSREQIAVAFGVSKSAVDGWMKLLDAPAAVKKAVADGTISVSAGAALAAKPETEITETIKAASQDGAKPTARNIKRVVEGKAPVKRVRRPKAMRSVEEIEERLAAVLEERKTGWEDWEESLLWVLNRSAKKS